ncbi:TPA: PqqD family peptide modification chaperone [Staphylococcus aureus]
MYLKIDSNTKIIEDYKGASIIYFMEEGVLSKDCNETGRYLLKMCDGSKTLEDILNIVKNDYKEIDENNIRSIRQFFNEYIKDGIIKQINKIDIDELHIVGNPNLVIPTNVSMELTNACQLRCLHCFNSSGKAREREISIEKFLDLAKYFVEIGTSTFFITGGEPLLKKDVEKLLDYLGTAGKTVTLATNGMKLNSSVIDILKKHPNIGVQVSIDGLERNHDFIRGVKGSFKKIINNIETMCKNGIPVSISFTMNDYNKNDIDELIDICKNLGCFGVSIGLTSNAGRAKENEVPTDIAKEFANILAESHSKYTTEDFQVGLDICEKKIDIMYKEIEHLNKCGAGYKEIHIMSDGKVTPCPAIPQIILGDVSKDNIEDIINYSNIEFIMNIPSPIKSLCLDCQLYENCGNCIASMLEVSQNDCRIQRELMG